MNSPLVSVVSLSYNRRANVLELLTALQEQTYKNFEVILVDNASSDGTAELVRMQFPEVKLIETDHNLGMVAYNLGFEQARGDYILVMDDDGLPASEDWIEQVVARFEANPDLGALSCTIRMRDTGRVAHDSPQFVPMGNQDTGYPGVAFNGTGAGLRAKALHAVGLYPVYFYLTYLELHLCARLLEVGWQVRHFPHLEVWHSRTSGTTHPIADYYGLRNYYWYIWEFYPAKHLLKETLHRTGFHLKLVKNRLASWPDFLKASLDAASGFPKAVLQRRVMSSRTLEYTRWVRRHGNWHGIAPAVVPFEQPGD